MLHVEVLRNEWSAGRQRVLARLVLNGTGEVRVDEGAEWEQLIPRAFRDPDTGDEVTIDDGEQFLRRLHRHLNGDYFFATEAHEAGECDLHVGNEIALQPTDAVTTPPAREAHPV